MPGGKGAVIASIWPGTPNRSFQHLYQAIIDYTRLGQRIGERVKSIIAGVMSADQKSCNGRPYHSRTSQHAPDLSNRAGFAVHSHMIANIIIERSNNSRRRTAD